MFTTRPGVFGLVGGFANPSGVALIVILTLMVVGSLSFVRRGGYFQIFYFSHLGYWLYWGLLVLHAPAFWQWLVLFAIIFLSEKLFRALSWLMGRGKTVIDEGVSLPSRVTCLRIKKPAKFNYSPGDWCFIKIPAIAIQEWHPFTISSAPEEPDHFSVHIRGVGHWTNKVYDHFKSSSKSALADAESNGHKGSVRHLEVVFIFRPSDFYCQIVILTDFRSWLTVRLVLLPATSTGQSTLCWWAQESGSHLSPLSFSP